jgi:hypothetical protein
MLDLSPIANAVKSVQSPAPQAQPAIAEEMRPVPETETPQAVPPPASAEPGLGEHLDLYDTQIPPPPPNPADQEKPKLSADLEKTKPQIEDKPKAKLNLLGKGTGLPQPTTTPPPPELPFLKPLGQPILGSSIDAVG